MTGDLPETVTELMSIRLNGPSVELFNPRPAISRWWKSGIRRRRTSALPRGPHTSQSLTPSHEASESSDYESDSSDINFYDELYDILL